MTFYQHPEDGPRLQLLGSPTVEHRGEAIPLEVDRPRSLLVLLALRGGWTPRAELALVYRPEDDERAANAYLRKLVFRAKRIAWSAGLAVEPNVLGWPVRTDVAELREAAARADNAKVVDLYPGPLLAHAKLPDVPGLLSVVEAERAELARLWREAALALAVEREAGGQLEEVQRLIEGVWSAEPLDEDALQRLLRVLLARDRHHDAWVIFERFRRQLDEEVGLEPLEATLALADLARATAAAGAGQTSLSASRSARQHIPRSVRGATLGTTQSYEIFGALPPVDGALIGREDELRRVEDWWASGEAEWVTVAGLGGVGKTRLAIELAHRRASIDQAVVFVQCAGQRDVADVAMAMARALELGPAGATSPVEQVLAHLAQRPWFVVLDDLTRELGAELAALLQAVGQVSVLATARSPLDVPGEWLVDLGGLASPPAASEVDERAFDAVRFFLARAERRGVVIGGGSDGLAKVAELCRRVDGLPLALELAAAWARVAPVSELVARLDSGAVEGGPPLEGVPPRQRDLTAVIAASLEQLDASERRELQVLAAYLAGFGLRASQHAVGGGLAGLSRLINLGLVRRSAESRYQLHALVRSVVWARASVEVREAASAKMRGFMGEQLRDGAADIKLGDELSAMDRLTPEVDAIKVAWRDALSACDMTTVAAMEEGLYLLLDARSAYHEGSASFGEALTAFAPQRTPGSGWEPLYRRLQARAGYFAGRLGQTDKAAMLLVAATDTNDPSELAFAVHNLGILDLFAGRNEAATARFEQALETYQLLDDGWGVSRAANTSGDGHTFDATITTLGTHVISATARDSDNAQANDTLEIEVVAACTINFPVVIEITNEQGAQRWFTPGVPFVLGATTSGGLPGACCSLDWYSDVEGFLGRTVGAEVAPDFRHRAHTLEHEFTQPVGQTITARATLQGGSEASVDLIAVTLHRQPVDLGAMSTTLPDGAATAFEGDTASFAVASGITDLVWFSSAPSDTVVVDADGDAQVDFGQAGPRTITAQYRNADTGVLSIAETRLRVGDALARP